MLEPRGDEFDIIYDNTSYQVEDLVPLVELFRGRVRQFVFTSSVAVYKRSFVQPVKEHFARHAADDPDPRKAYGAGKVACEDYLAHLHRTEGFPATSLRVTHTVGPKTPLASREPVFFARLEQGRPILVPGAEITSILGCVRLMARAVGVEAEVVHVPLDVARRARPPLVHWGEGLVGGAMFSIDKARSHLDWEPAFGLEAAYRDAYEWFDAEGRDRFEFDFSGDDAILAELNDR